MHASDLYDRKGAADIAVLLIDEGADLDRRDKDCDTALLHACRNNHDTKSRVVDKLMEKKAAVNVRGKNGHTPLSHAVYAGLDRMTTAIRRCGLPPVAGRKEFCVRRLPRAIARRSAPITKRFSVPSRPCARPRRNSSCARFLMR